MRTLLDLLCARVPLGSQVIAASMLTFALQTRAPWTVRSVSTLSQTLTSLSAWTKVHLDVASC